MDADFVAKMKARILAEKEAILDTMQKNNAEFVSGGEKKVGNDDIDDAAESQDRKMLAAMNEKDAARLKQIDAALLRIEQNKYGKCMKCGEPIPQARLEAIPYALLCVKCKSENERRR